MTWSLISILTFLIVWFAPLILGLNLAKRKRVNRNWMWFSVHPMLSWVGYLIVARKQLKVNCPECYSEIHPQARLCPYCSSKLPENRYPSDSPKDGLHTTLALITGPLALTLFFTSFFINIANSIKDTWAYGEAWNRIENSQEAQGFLGGEMETSSFVNGSFQSNRTSINFEVEGAKGLGKVIIGAHRELKTWSMDTLWIVDNTLGDTLDLSDNK